MADLTIEIKGLPDLMRKLGDIEGRAYLRGVLEAAASDFKSWIAVYPPATEANSPGGGRWYERGYGSRWTRADGTIGGRQTSETLGRKWTTSVATDGMSATIGNNASYVRYVQDEEKQAWFHAERGWRTAQQGIKERSGEIVRKIREAVEAIWRR